MRSAVIDSFYGTLCIDGSKMYVPGCFMSRSAEIDTNFIQVVVVLPLRRIYGADLQLMMPTLSPLRVCQCVSHVNLFLFRAEKRQPSSVCQQLSKCFFCVAKKFVTDPVRSDVIIGSTFTVGAVVLAMDPFSTAGSLIIQGNAKWAADLSSRSGPRSFKNYQKKRHKASVFVYIC